jgi:hypothetical protein
MSRKRSGKVRIKQSPPDRPHNIDIIAVYSFYSTVKKRNPSKIPCKISSKVKSQMVTTKYL